MRRRPNTDSSAALLDGFHGVLDLVKTSLWAPCRHVRVILRTIARRTRKIELNECAKRPCGLELNGSAASAR